MMLAVCSVGVRRSTLVGVGMLSNGYVSVSMRVHHDGHAATLQHHNKHDDDGGLALAALPRPGLSKIWR